MNGKSPAPFAMSRTVIHAWCSAGTAYSGRKTRAGIAPSDHDGTCPLQWTCSPDHCPAATPFLAGLLPPQLEVQGVRTPAQQKGLTTMTKNTAAYIANNMQGFPPAVRNYMLSLLSPEVGNRIKQNIAAAHVEEPKR